MLLKNAICLDLDSLSPSARDLRIKDGIISEAAAGLSPEVDEDVYDLREKIVLPGFVCAHTHLYSSLSRGMPGPERVPRNFREILSHIWWKLDCALDEESIYYSACVGAVEALLGGTTTIVDHHASPTMIPGSLDLIKRALTDVGARGILCYEVTDRGGRKKRDAGLEENARFIQGNKKDRMFRGMVGAHASFTLSDDSLQRCGDLAATFDAGVHIHVAEDACDVAPAKVDHDGHIIHRLDKHGILRRRSILAHCIHLNGRDFQTLRRRQCWLVHNPRSNMNNGVGYAPLSLFGKRSALGTDGFPADMLEEVRSAMFKMQDERKGRGTRRGANKRVTPPELLYGSQRLASEIFGTKLGTLEQGAAADLVVMGYVPPTPMTKENIMGHVLFGMRSSGVESVIVNGRWVVKDRSLVGLDLPGMFLEASKAAGKMWKRMEKISSR